MKIFGKTLLEYIWPIKWYIIASIIIVIFQYEGMLAYIGYNETVARITQWLWEIFVVLAVFKLIWKYNFNFKQIFFVGILFSVIIHGLKAFIFRVFFFPYSPESWPWLHLYKFLYGTAIVMAVTFATYILTYYYKKKQEKIIFLPLEF